jgi:hypothetical protein
MAEAFDGFHPVGKLPTIVIPLVLRRVQNAPDLLLPVLDRLSLVQAGADLRQDMQIVFDCLMQMLATQRSVHHNHLPHLQPNKASVIFD